MEWLRWFGEKGLLWGLDLQTFIYMCKETKRVKTAFIWYEERAGQKSDDNSKQWDIGECMHRHVQVNANSIENIIYHL